MRIPGLVASLIVGVAVVMAGCAAHAATAGGRTEQRSSGPAPTDVRTAVDAGSGSAASSSTAAVDSIHAVQINSVRLPGPAYNLAFDPFRDVLWYATVTAPNRATLYEASTATGEVLAQFGLPNDDAVALGGAIAIAPDHSVWVTEPYALVRVDPATAAVDRLSLPRDIAGALPAATNPHALQSGTPVSSLTFTTTSALVGRVNVPYLQQFSLVLEPMPTIGLPHGDTGPAVLTIIGSELHAAFHEQGPPGLTIRQETIPLPTGLAAPDAPDGGPLNPALLATREDGININLTTPSRVYVLDSASSGSESAQWEPTQPGPVLLVPLRTFPGHVANPFGVMVAITYRAQVIAATQLPDGTLWIVQGAKTTWSLTEYRTPS